MVADFFGDEWDKDREDPRYPTTPCTHHRASREPKPLAVQTLSKLPPSLSTTVPPQPPRWPADPSTAPPELSKTLPRTAETQQNNDMPLTKQRPPPRRKGGDLTTHHGFSQARLDRLCDSMQPLMTRHVLEAEMEKIFGEADKYVFGPVDKVPCSRSGKGKRRWFRGGCGWGGWVSGRVMRLWGFSC